MNQPKRNAISRRQFTRRAAMLSAAASVVPAASAFANPASVTPPQAPLPAHPGLSPESQTEADARLQQILAQYGSRFSEDEKSLLQKINVITQQALDRVRVYPLQNSDSPALYLKPLVEREKKKSESPASSPAKQS